MAPTISSDLDAAPLLSARQYYGSGSCRSGYYYRNGSCYSSWSYFGRWIFLALLIGLGILVLFGWACLNTRRRRRRGMRPMYGTGWMAGGAPPPGAPYQSGPQGYNPPPPYGPPGGQSYPMNNQPTGNTFQTGDGYYAQNEGVQPPKNVYAPAGGNDYAPPPGPPPANTRPY